MPVLKVGKTEIPYQIRRSERAGRMRIVVKPGQVEVVVPTETEETAIGTFVQKKRQWVFNKRQEVEEQAQALQSSGPSRFVTGAKIPFRGRHMRLTVTQGEGPEAEVAYRNGFHVSVPSGLAVAQRDQAVEEALKSWFLDRLRRDVDQYVDRFAKSLGARPIRVNLKEQKHLWGSCGRDNIINLNWYLIFSPKPVLEYAVLHEMCHLIERNHSQRFWVLVGEQMPDYELKKRWLEKHDEGSVSGLLTTLGP